MRDGHDDRFARDIESGARQHTIDSVYSEMFLEVCRWYASLPNPRTLTLSEIRFFYEGIRPALHATTKPRKKRKN